MGVCVIYFIASGMQFYTCFPFLIFVVFWLQVIWIWKLFTCATSQVCAGSPVAHSSQGGRQMGNAAPRLGLLVYCRLARNPHVVGAHRHFAARLQADDPKEGPDGSCLHSLERFDQLWLNFRVVILFICKTFASARLCSVAYLLTQPSRCCVEWSLVK